MSKLLKGGYIGDDIGSTIGVIKGDTKSLDYSSYGLVSVVASLRIGYMGLCQNKGLLFGGPGISWSILGSP